MRRITAIIFTLVLAAQSIFSQSSTYDFLHLDVSARAAALNGSFVSMTNDPNVLFYNPASLATISAPKASVCYLNHLMDVNAGSLSFAQYMESIGNIGAGVTYIDYGSFNETDAYQNILGTFGARELAVIAGIATHYDDLTLLGINAKYIYSSIQDYSSTALAIDLGILYEIPEQGITIGGSILNLGKQLKSYSSTNESLPLDIKIGITKRPEHVPVLLNLNFHKLNEKSESFLTRFSNFTFGAEFEMSESVRFRVGYNNEQRKDLKLDKSAGLAGYSMGGGILLKEYLIDYAFNSYGKIGGLHRFSLGINL
jgi:hypothetical protein